MTDHHRHLEQMYHTAPCNQSLSPALVVSEGAATVRMLARPELHHAGGAVHGSFCFKLLDDAAYFAANSVVEDVLVLTASFQINLLGMVVNGELRAEGTLIRSGRTLIFAESKLYDEKGRLIATGSGTFARSRIPLSSIS